MTPDERDDEPFNPALASLGALRERLPPGPARTDAPSPQRRGSAGAAAPARAVIRLERSGRRGKEVTVVEHLALSAEQRDAWLKTLKARLGCGGAVEGEALVLQGDLRKRLAPLLTELGVRKIVLGTS